jgi:pyruvyltransferase
MAVYLKYFQKKNNIGDRFSLFLANKYFPGEIIGCDEKHLDKPNLILIGSILQWGDSQSHICGAGFIASNAILNCIPASLNCIRGPLTGESLRLQGLPTTNCYADPGILAPAFFPQNKPSSFKLGIIPHYVDAHSPWVEICRKEGIKVIDVLAPFEVFFEQLQSCETIISSSLHGIIFAHAYNKPALWIEISDLVIGDGFKFYDYYQSLDIMPESVKRIKVTSSTDPFEIAKLATSVNQTLLFEGLEEAIQKTKKSIFNG